VCRKLQMTAAVQSIALASREASRGEARRGLRVTGSCASPRLLPILPSATAPVLVSFWSIHSPRFFSSASSLSLSASRNRHHQPARSADLTPTIHPPTKKTSTSLPAWHACVHACLCLQPGGPDFPFRVGDWPWLGALDGPTCRRPQSASHIHDPTTPKAPCNVTSNIRSQA